jgi:hypothetical protein
MILDKQAQPDIPAGKFPVTYIRPPTSHPKPTAFTRIELMTSAHIEISSFVRTASSGLSNQKPEAHCGEAKGSR